MEEASMEDDAVEDEENHERLLMAASFLVIAHEESRQRRIDQRNQSRTYLCRPDLLPNPREGTPWTTLYNSRNNRAYITTMGFDVDTFDYIRASGFARKWDETPVPRADAEGRGDSRPGGRSLDAAGALGLLLHYLSSTMREISLQEIFALIPSTVFRYITFGLQILLEILRRIGEAEIEWPDDNAFALYTHLIVRRHTRLHGAFGSIDGLNLAVQTSGDQDIENATYNDWLSAHFVSSVLVFSPRGEIVACNLNAPGSWHDSHVAQPIFEKLRSQTPDGYYLVADAAFPRGTQDIRERIQAPLKPGQSITGSAFEIEGRMAFNRELLSYRQTADWGMRALQGSFGRLRILLEVDYKDRTADLLEICVCAHNLRTRRVGINRVGQQLCMMQRFGIHLRMFSSQSSEKMTKFRAFMFYD
ncbi:hypothetical protein FA15DRAFT_604134 [Coprinopsis marcescibilis]|uniref:DDE Tnp4 domain-containing protein n=1 Tax=Coprinopsis marcescibilis TaxID=230819 RepID=A0A5C3KD35_COPMA|nr:hypothetical protein FA15DRAFT_604134 [Coprinopsis marcescibilis]